MSKNKETYRVQYDVVSTTMSDDVLSVCFHEPGRVGFDTINDARRIVALLRQAEEDLGQSEHTTYEIRPVVVSDAFMRTLIDVDEDEIFDLMSKAADDTSGGTSGSKDN